MLERWLDVFTALEKQLDQDIAVTVGEVPIFEEMSAVKGIGPTLAAKIIAMVDIERANTVSALWKYAGYGLGYYWQDESGKICAPQSGYKWQKNGEGDKERVLITPEPKPGWELVQVRDRPIEGFTLSYNKRLKTTLFLVAGSFMKSGSPYRRIYDSAKEYYVVNNPDWSAGHADRAAQRKMIKIFLSHLWERWRLLAGLPIRLAFVNEQLGHETIYPPEEFGWPGAEGLEVS